MPRLSSDTLRQLEQGVSLERLVTDDGVELQEGNGVLTGRCPRHPDEGTVRVDPAANTWSCPECEVEHGGPVEWVMTNRRVSRSRAIDILASGVGVQDEIHWPDADTGNLDAVVSYYHRRLLGSDEGLAFLERRGLRDDDLIRHLRLGLADRTLGYRLPSRNSTAGAELRGRLQALGVLRTSGHEHLAGSLVVPIIGIAGIADLYGRKVSSKLRGGTVKHLFLQPEPPGPWFLHPDAEGDEIVVTASVIDAITWWAVGQRRVLVTPMMTLGEPHLSGLVEGLGSSRVVFAYPRTNEAHEVIGTAAPLIADLGMTVSRIVFPEGQDANDIHVQGGDLMALVRNAEWVATPASTSSSTAPEPEAPFNDNYPEPGPNGDEVVMNIGDRRWRIRGLLSNKTPETMRVNLMVNSDETLHVDTFDLYSHRHRAGFAKEAGVELGLPEKTIKADMGKVIFLLEDLQDKAFAAQQDPKNEPPRMTPREETEALELLRDPGLVGRVADDLTRIGLVGEAANKIIVYLAATSRLLEDPLAVVVQSTSGSGKSALLEGVLRMMPPESTKSFSAMTGQSLYYLGEDDLRHKILSVSEERGATKASYSLKLLQSEKTITIASTGKDPGTGRLKTETYTVEGPVALMMTTTAAIVDEELANRCVVVSVDEGRHQTRAIHARQRHQETLDGLLGDLTRDNIIETHRNAQRLLRPLHVVNPFARDLTFSDHAPRTRRDHQKYLGLIRAVALLHQYQRQVKTAEHGGTKVEYIEVAPEDIKVANGLCHELFGRSLDDLLPQTRRLLVLIHEMVVAKSGVMGIEPGDVRFTRRMIREHVGWGQTQLRVHLSRLVEMEYVLAHRAGATSATVYELAWTGEGQDGSPFIVGLSDPVKLAGQDRPKNGPETAGERVVKPVEETEEMASDRTSCDQRVENARRGQSRKPPSYPGGHG